MDRNSFSLLMMASVVSSWTLRPLCKNWRKVCLKLSSDNWRPKYLFLHVKHFFSLLYTYKSKISVNKKNNLCTHTHTLLHNWIVINCLIYTFFPMQKKSSNFGWEYCSIVIIFYFCNKFLYFVFFIVFWYNNIVHSCMEQWSHEQNASIQTTLNHYAMRMTQDNDTKLFDLTLIFMIRISPSRPVDFIIWKDCGWAYFSDLSITTFPWFFFYIIIHHAEYWQFIINNVPKFLSVYMFA